MYTDTYPPVLLCVRSVDANVDVNAPREQMIYIRPTLKLTNYPTQHL